MNTYFIHTFELCCLLTYEEYVILNRNLKRINLNGHYKCLKYAQDGIIISFCKCSENEQKRKGFSFPYKLFLVVNPSRLIVANTFVNKILHADDFIRSMHILDDKINSIFGTLIPEISRTDYFDLSRIDITKDIHNIPENIIHKYIRITRKLPLHYGYHLNNQLEEKCTSYSQEDSVNIINDTNKTEFVLYNKHKATIDQGYPEDVQKQYKDVLRMELRCGRNFIRKKTKDMYASEALEYFYHNMQPVVSDIFNRLFLCGNDTCFLSYSWLKKMIKRLTGSRKKKREKMLNLAIALYKNPDKEFDDVLFRLFNSDKARNNVISYFVSINLSPIAIPTQDIPYLQSLNSLLEFKMLSEDEKFYFKFVQHKERNKEIFLNYFI